MRRLLLFLFFLLSATAMNLLAAALSEELHFNAAKQAFNAGFFERSEKEFAEFTGKYTNSTHLAEASLRQAQSRFEREKKTPADTRNFAPVIELLSAQIGQAGKWAGHYRYWIGEAQFESGRYQAAADAFAQVIKEFPGSTLALPAAYGEALARHKLGDAPRAIELLRRPDLAFQKAAQVLPIEEVVARGNLLLAELLLAQNDFPAAQAALDTLINKPLSAEQKWQRQYLQVRLQLANRQSGAALQGVTNLLTLVTPADTGALRAESIALHGQILQKLNQPAAAIQVYTNNLAEGTPTALRRQALLNIVELTLAQDKLPEAIQWLETFLSKHSQDSALDLARLTLGELRLKQYFAATNAPASTNTLTAAATLMSLLPEAKAHFEFVITNSQQKSLVGKAQLGKGWCLWEESKIADCQAAFKAATEQLPASEEQAVARFKWADAQFRQKDFPGALTNYNLLVTQYATWPRVKDAVLDRALYQLMLASIEVGDPASATNALEKILTWFPESYLSDRSVLLAGQAFNRQRQPGEARSVFESFLRSFPNSPLLPEAKLAIALTFVQEENWPEGTRHYDAWTAQFTNHFALPQVEFDRAWVYDQARLETNALTLFTNFVARFSTNMLALKAQQWVGDYYSRLTQFDKAELEYQRLYQNTNLPPSELTYRARIMAGRSAMARRSYSTARDYFLYLITNGPPLLESSPIPPAIAAEAYLELGNATLLEPTTNALTNYEEALKVFAKIPQFYPTNRLTPLALGKMADCHLQLATKFSDSYGRAAQFYTEVMDSPLADFATRSAAEVGLGLVLEKQSAEQPPPEKEKRAREALNRYLNVFYGKQSREGEQADAFWISKAGVEAARWAEALQLWCEAAGVYSRLVELFPHLRSKWERSLENAHAKCASAAKRHGDAGR